MLWSERVLALRRFRQGCLGYSRLGMVPASAYLLAKISSRFNCGSRCFPIIASFTLLPDSFDRRDIPGWPECLSILCRFPCPGDGTASLQDYPVLDPDFAHSWRCVVLGLGFLPFFCLPPADVYPAAPEVQ